MTVINGLACILYAILHFFESDVAVTEDMRLVREVNITSTIASNLFVKILIINWRDRRFAFSSMSYYFCI